MAATAQAAPSPALEKVAAGLSARYGGLSALTAAYRRVAAAPAADQVFKSSSQQVAGGVLYWARPDRLLLEQAFPQPEVMVTDGATVWWHIPAENLVYRYRDIDVAGQLKPLLLFLGGLETLARDYELEPAPADPARPGQTGLRLIPKAADPAADRLTVWCDENFALAGFSLAAITGETADFFLNGLTENPPLDEKLFSFRPPRGAEIIDEENGK